MHHSAGHTTKRTATRFVRLPLIALVAATALLAAACTTGGGSGGPGRPTAVASATPSTGTAPLAVTFSSAGSIPAPGGLIVAYSWLFGDGTAAVSTPNPTHTYNASGTFPATLTVTDGNGLTSTAITWIDVAPGASNQSPVAVIGATPPTSGKAPLTVAFNSTGTHDNDGTIVTYSWDWGDGTAYGTVPNPSHVYAAAGSFVAKLTVTDNLGATSSATTLVSTVGNVSPSAVATASATLAIAPAAITFDSSGSTDSDGTIAARKWNFGDGSPLDTTSNPSHTYTSPGNYVVTLRVVDDTGAIDIASINLTVLSVNQPPVAVGNATPSSGKAPLTAVFSSAGSVDNDGTIVSYSWDFADGSPLDSNPNPTHLYSTPGTYPATLTVTDNRTFPSPGVDVATVPIHVGLENVAPVAVGSVTPTTGKIPLPVAFSSAGSTDSDGTIVGYDWNFGDGTAHDTSASPSHTYALPGTYTATLTVTDDDGATNQVPVTVHRVLNIFPSASAQATPASGKGPLNVAFTSSGSVDTDGTIASYSWDFGDGSALSTSANTSHSYPPGNYTATLTVTDDSGDSDSKTLSIVSNPNVVPTASANASIGAGNAPLAVTFTSAGSVDPDGTIASYSWNFGDGSALSSSPTPAHTFLIDGVYSVLLTVTDNEGAIGTTALTITVNPNPAPIAVPAVTSITPSTGKVPANVVFNSTGSSDDGSIVAYSWDFGDGSALSTSANPTHLFTSINTFVVSLTVTDNGGLTNTATTTVDVIPNLSPNAVATATPSSGKAPLVVALSSAGSGDPDGTIVGYSWNFGDPASGALNTSTSANASHTYPVGTFTATLTVTDDDGNNGVATAVVSTVANQHPVAVANVTPAGGKAPLLVTFSSAGSVDNDGTVVGYSWNFNDPASGAANTSTLPNPTHTFATPGTRTATLTVTDDSGDTGTATVPVLVGNFNVAPVAGATATPSSGKRNLEVHFSSATSTDSDGTIVGYSWDFGDLSPLDTTANPIHTYTVGTWTATLTVTDDDGATNTKAVTIHSNPPQAPIAAATATPASAKYGTAVAFSSAGSHDPDDAIVSYSWDFNDGSPLETTANATHSYAIGTYVATLTVTDEEGLTDTKTVNVTANPNQPPIAVANSNKTTGSAPLAVNFTSTGSTDPDDSIASYSWDFNDSSALDPSPNPSHTFNDAGTYNVTLTVTDQDGATATATKVITVVSDIEYVRVGGSDANPGTKSLPKATIQGALSAAATLGQSQVQVAGGSYGSFTVVSGVSVTGGFDQSFDAGGSNGATTVTVTGAASTPGITATGVTVSTTLKNLTVQGGNGANATGLLAQTNSVLTLDTLTINSGTATGAGSSAYGVRVISGSNVTVTNSTVTAANGVAGSAGTNGATGATGAGGNNGSGTSGGGVATGSPTVRTGGQGGGGKTSGLAGSGGAGTKGGAGDTNGGAAGAAGNTSTYGGGAGGGGAAAAASSAGAAGAAGSTGDTFAPSNAGNAGTAGNGAGGGGGGGGGAPLLTSAGGGGSGGIGGGGGGAGTGGGGGGGSFGVYARNATVTVTGSTVTTGNGGNGGAGGAGGNGGAGGKGGNGVNSGNSGGGGGGGGGGAAGNGGSGGGGGAGGPSVGVTQTGSGSQTVTSSTITPGTGGTGGAGGAFGTKGAVGASGTAGTSTTGGRNGTAGVAGAAGADGVAGASGPAG